MANKVYKLSMVGIIAIIVFGAVMAFNGYNSDIYPLDRMRGHLDGIIGSSDPTIIQSHLVTIKQDLAIVLNNLPEDNKNPVWIFPTESTNFLRIEGDVNTLIASIEKISNIPKDSSAYHTGMMDISDRALLIKTNLMDATPYMYVSISNVLFSTIWIAAIIGIFAALKRKKEQFKEIDDSGV